MKMLSFCLPVSCSVIGFLCSFCLVDLDIFLLTRGCTLFWSLNLSRVLSISTNCDYACFSPLPAVFQVIWLFLSRFWLPPWALPFSSWEPDFLLLRLRWLVCSRTACFINYSLLRFFKFHSWWRLLSERWVLWRTRWAFDTSSLILPAWRYISLWSLVQYLTEFNTLLWLPELPWSLS